MCDSHVHMQTLTTNMGTVVRVTVLVLDDLFDNVKHIKLISLSIRHIEFLCCVVVVVLFCCIIYILKLYRDIDDGC